MVTKTSSNGIAYEIDATKKVAQFVWHPEDDDGETGTLPDIRIPLRLKLGALIDIGLEHELDMQFMVTLLGSIVPASHMETLKAMDVNDFQEMFSTWQDEYNALTGGSLGESSPSGDSSSSTAPASNTTGALASA